MASFYSRQQIVFSLASSIGWVTCCGLTALTTFISLFTENTFTEILTGLQLLALLVSLISFMIAFLYGGLAFPRFDSKNRFLVRIESLVNFSSNPKGLIVSSLLLVAVFYGVFMTNGVANDLFMIVCSIMVALLFLPNAASLIRVFAGTNKDKEDELLQKEDR
jgi:hypothetical protein